MNYSNSFLPINERKNQNGFYELFEFVNNKISSPSLNYNGAVKKLIDAESELSCHMQLIDMASLLSVSDLKGNIIFANDKFCEVSKYSLDELVGQPNSVVRHPDTPSSLFQEMWKKIESGRIWQGEIKNLAKDGSAYWVLATIAPVIGKNRKPIKYISMHVDITKQKMVEEELKETKGKINNELHESVNYGKYVHNSFLTPEEEIEFAFPESLLIYKAQNIISGDFYRIQRNGSKATVVLGDSTGHGISASYISIIILKILTRILRMGSNNPSKILEVMHREMQRTIHSTHKHPIIESADMMVCCIDFDTLLMDYASAKMRGVIIRDGEIIELNKDKFSVGESSDRVFGLANHEIQLFKGDQIYMFSDGLSDQFGGLDNKKFTSKRLMNLLVKHNAKPMLFQKESIIDEITHWQGDNEQTDDITLLGLKIE